MTNFKIMKFAIPVVLIAALSASVIKIMDYRAEVQRLKENQDVLLAPEMIVEYRTSLGKSVSEVQALNLKVSELKASNDTLLNITRELGIKNRRLMELAQATTKTSHDIMVPVRDSIIQRPAINDSIEATNDTLRCLTYVDSWLSLDGCIHEDTFTGSIENRDTLDFIVHKIPKRFLFFRFGCKAIHLDVVSHNPHSIITHAKYVRITK